eukprot:TRINITY_DN1635_c0_g2_i1.p1 TRINITY_DN1635_c0_g2~~TRINITY_DN1635_c0_g2_i1.p1  ORF type:complete len:980 (+),score=310.95 TRINITY_DN1635_c0_g2_i1:1025-3964(+)
MTSHPPVVKTTPSPLSSNSLEMGKTKKNREKKKSVLVISPDFQCLLVPSTGHITSFSNHPCMDILCCIAAPTFSFAFIIPLAINSTLCIHFSARKKYPLQFLSFFSNDNVVVCTFNHRQNCIQHPHNPPIAHCIHFPPDVTDESFREPPPPKKYRPPSRGSRLNSSGGKKAKNSTSTSTSSTSNPRKKKTTRPSSAHKSSTSKSHRDRDHGRHSDSEEEYDLNGRRVHRDKHDKHRPSRTRESRDRERELERELEREREQRERDRELFEAKQKLHEQHQQQQQHQHHGHSHGESSIPVAHGRHKHNNNQNQHSHQQPGAYYPQQQQPQQFVPMPSQSPLPQQTPYPAFYGQPTQFGESSGEYNDFGIEKPVQDDESNINSGNPDMLASDMNPLLESQPMYGSHHTPYSNQASSPSLYNQPQPQQFPQQQQQQPNHFGGLSHMQNLYQQQQAAMAQYQPQQPDPMLASLMAKQGDLSEAELDQYLMSLKDKYKQMGDRTAGEVAMLRQQIDEQAKLLTASEYAKDEMRQQMTNMRQDMDSMREELRKEKEEILRDTIAMEKKAEALQRQVDKQKELIERNQADKESLIDQNLALDTENKKLSEVFNDYERKLKQKDEKIEELAQAALDLKHDLSRYSQASGAFDSVKELRELVDEKKELESDLANMKVELDNTKNTNQRLEDECAKLVDDVSSLRAQLQNTKFEAMQKQAQNIWSQLAGGMKKDKSDQARLLAEKVEYEHRYDETKEKLVHAEDFIEELQAKNQRLLEEVTKAEKRAVILDEQKDKCLEMLESEQLQFREIDEANTDLLKEKMLLLDQIGDMRSELEETEERFSTVADENYILKAACDQLLVKLDLKDGLETLKPEEFESIMDNTNQVTKTITNLMSSLQELKSLSHARTVTTGSMNPNGTEDTDQSLASQLTNIQLKSLGGQSNQNQPRRGQSSRNANKSQHRAPPSVRTTNKARSEAGESLASADVPF